MGFSFSDIREELDSKELGKLYKRLQADCLYLAPFSDWKAVIAFLHDQARGYRLKDRILWRMIQYYRQGGDYERLGVVFLAIFEPGILGLYGFWRERCFNFGDDDLFQEICLTMLAVLKEKPITAKKVAGQVVGTMKNRIHAMLDRHAGVAPINSGVEPISETHSTDDTPGSLYDEFADVMKVLDFLGVSDAQELLDLLARQRVIDWEEKRLIEAALIKDKIMKGISRTGRRKGLDLRRENALKALGYHLSKIMK
jgi:hypothetical protein